MSSRMLSWVVVLMLGASACGLAAPGAADTQPATRKDYGEEFVRSSKYAGPFTQENLDRLKKALVAPETRMTALRELIDFAGGTLYQVGSVSWVYGDGSTESRRQAAALAEGAADDKTVMAALRGDDPVVAFWGIWNFSAVKDHAAGVGELERLAKGPDETLRARAAERLLKEGGKMPPVAEEKSPWVIESMLGNKTLGEFNVRLKALLKDPDAGVRKKAIEFLEGSWIRAAARQLWINASIMDGVLACAQGKGDDAGAALETFKQLTNQDKLADAAAADAWWKDHRSDWELARYPRWQMPNGSRVYASIQTTGDVGGANGWQATITLENHGKDVSYVNLADVARLNWMLFDTKGERAVDPFLTKPPAADAEWVALKPGDTVARNSPISLKPGLAPGRYMLRAYLFLGLDRTGLPEGAMLHQGEVPLPLIWVEAVGKEM